MIARFFGKDGFGFASYSILDQIVEFEDTDFSRPLGEMI